MLIKGAFKTLPFFISDSKEIHLWNLKYLLYSGINGHKNEQPAAF